MIQSEPQSIAPGCCVAAARVLRAWRCKKEAQDVGGFQTEDESSGEEAVGGKEESKVKKQIDVGSTVTARTMAGHRLHRFRISFIVGHCSEREESFGRFVVNEANISWVFGTRLESNKRDAPVLLTPTRP
jgi:hypothetical protein